MKKQILLTLYIILSGVTLFAQVDSAEFYDLVITGGTIANTIRPQNWIQGIPNEWVSTVVTTVAMFVYGIFHRNKEKKKLRKQGKLIDK